MVTDDDDLYSQGALTQSEVARGCWYGVKGFIGEKSSELSLKKVGVGVCKASCRKEVTFKMNFTGSLKGGATL